MNRFKLPLALLGFGLAAVGVALDIRLVVEAAIIVLAASLGVRLWERRRLRLADEQPPETHSA